MSNLVVAPGQTSIDYASPDLSNMPAGSWRGFIDRWDVLEGVFGWVLFADTPSLPVAVELVAGSHLIETVQAGEARPDIEGILGVRTTPGFHFPASVFGRLARLRDRDLDQVVTVRIAGTDVLLRPRDESPTVRTLVDAWSDALVGALKAPGPEPTNGSRLLARLSALRAQAEAFRNLPLRPNQDTEIGHVEGVYFASEGQIWMTGWIRRAGRYEFPAIIVDRQKYPAGMSVFCFERQDLASSCVGMIGILDTSWVPAPLDREVFIYVGDDARLQIRIPQGARNLGAEAFGAAVRQARNVATSGHIEAIGSLLSSEANWVPDAALTAGTAGEASIDRLLVLPGFGCFAEGWAVSQAKRVQAFQMKIGNCVFIEEQGSTYFKPRPDLQEAFSGIGAATGRAGFVTVFRGEIDASLLGAAYLRVVLEDGTGYVKRIDAKAVKLLDVSADGEEILRLYCSLRHEPFYRDFLRGVRRQIDAAVREPLIQHLVPSERAIVVRLSASIANRTLWLDQASAFLSGGLDGIGICFVVDRQVGLTDVKLLVHELAEASRARLSLMCVDGAEEAFGSLPLIVRRLGCTRFVYVGCGLMLTSRGWEHVIAHLQSEQQTVALFEIVDESGAPDRVQESISAACFGWTTVALLEWASNAPRLLDGVRGLSGLPESPDYQLLKGCTLRLERPKASRLAEMVDQDLLRMPRSTNLAA